MPDLYDTDFYQWTKEQAAALAAGHVAELDLAHLAEEIDDLGKNNWRELSSRLEILVMHLLKWVYQPEMRETGHSWASSIFTQRSEILKLLKQNPSLRRQVEPSILEDYPHSRRLANLETKLPLKAFPEACPWTAAQVLDLDLYPEEPRHA